MRLCETVTSDTFLLQGPEDRITGEDCRKKWQRKRLKPAAADTTHSQCKVWVKLDTPKIEFPTTKTEAAAANDGKDAFK